MKTEKGDRDMKALIKFYDAIELEKEGEDGSTYLQKVCDDFELAQLNGIVQIGERYRHIVDDAIKLNRAMGAKHGDNSTGKKRRI